MRIAARLLLLSMVSGGVLGLGACAMPDMDSFKAPDASAFFRPMSVTGFKEKQLAPVTAADLVDAGGRCAGGGPAMAAGAPDSGRPMAESGTASPSPEEQLLPGGVALGMTECDVVHHAGAPERVEIGAGESNERTATLTYTQGPRPGIYHFAEGRLKSMERAPEPVVAAKSQTKSQKKRAKPARRAATQPNQVTVQ